MCEEERLCFLLEVFSEEQQNGLEELKRVEKGWSLPELYYFWFLMRSKLIYQCVVMICISRGKNTQNRAFLPHGRTWVYEKWRPEAIQRSSCSQNISELYLWLLFATGDNAEFLFTLLWFSQSNWLHNQPLQRIGCCGYGCFPFTCWEETFLVIRLGLKPNDNDQLQQFSWGCTWGNLGRRVSYVKTQYPKVCFLVLSWNLSKTGADSFPDIWNS